MATTVEQVLNNLTAHGSDKALELAKSLERFSPGTEVKMPSGRMAATLKPEPGDVRMVSGKLVLE